MIRIEEIEKEVRQGEKAEQEGNSGRARVCARRAAGIALENYYARMGENPGKDAMKLLAQFSGASEIPGDVRDAALRLQERVRPDFTSASRQPLNDARLIINFVTTFR